MPTPANGTEFPGLGAGLTSVKVKNTGADPTASRLDASTLDLEPGSFKVYVDGLPDAGPGALAGVGTTITATYIETPAFAAGDTITVMGSPMRVTDIETENAVGELVKTTVTLVLDPTE